MKVIAFIGSARKKHTYYASEILCQKLLSLGDVEYELVQLSNYNLKTCKGCKLCTDKGEELCPLNDDRDKLIEKIRNSDGIIFASPNYSFNLSGLMKVFLDRFNPYFHRPEFFGKAFTSIVAQGVYGGGKINKYFSFIGNGLGFNVVNGCCITTLEPMTEEVQKKNDRIIEKLSKKFYSTLQKKEHPVPTLFKLMIFRMARTSIKLMLDESWRDYAFYKNSGWFKSDYYYPIQLNPLKRLSGKFFDFLFTRIYPKNVAGNQLQPTQTAEF
jgi:multimeric flavodoxin WrbA